MCFCILPKKANKSVSVNKTPADVKKGLGDSMDGKDMSPF